MTAPHPTEQPDPEQAPRPDLRVVPDSDTTGHHVRLPVLPATLHVYTERVQPQAPWQYRVHDRLAELAYQLPAAWSQRPASFAERVTYSREGDWAVAESSGKRSVHLIGTLACLAVDLALTAVRACTRKPSRLGLLFALLLVAAYVL